MPLDFQLVSDLHLEKTNDNGSAFVDALPVASDVLVVAGDLTFIQFFDQLKVLFEKLCRKRRRVYYVPGNHEYYKLLPREAEALLSAVEEELPTLKILRPGYVDVLDGQRVLGASLWFPEDPFSVVYSGLLDDFQKIKSFVPWVYEQNTAAVSFFEKELRKGDVVITHHLPTFRSVAEKYVGSNLNRYFVCDLERLIVEREPVLWMHGHTHIPCDHHVGGCRIVANPRGYPDGPAHESFNDKLVLSV